MFRRTAILLALLPIALSACSNASVSQLPSHAPQATMIAAGRSLQMGTFTVPTSTQMPTPAPTTNDLPDFSSASLDWDDVYSAVLSRCTSITADCQSEITKAFMAEVGDPNDQSILPGSRAYLCQRNLACYTKGYSNYNGTTPLPSFIPSAKCQAEFKGCITNPAALKTQYPEAFSTNCDNSDGICIPENPLGQ